MGPGGPTSHTRPVLGREYEYPVQEAPKEEPKPSVTCFYCRTQRENAFKCCPRCGGNDIVQPPDPLAKPRQNSGTSSCGPRWQNWKVHVADHPNLARGAEYINEETILSKEVK